MFNRKQSLLIFTVILGVLEAGQCAAPVAPKQLNQLVEEALKHNARLKAAGARIDEAEAARREVQSHRLPSLSARSTLSRGDPPVYVFGSLMAQGRFGPNNFAIDSLNHPGDLTNVQSSLDLSFPVFTGFELTSTARQGAQVRQQAIWSHEQAVQQLRQQTVTLYLELLRARAISKTLDERLAASREEMDDARRLKDRGVVLGSDYYAAESILSGLHAWKIQSEAQERSVLSELEILTGASELVIQGTLSETVYTIPSESEALQQALQRRPDLAASSSQLEMVREKSMQIRRSLLPQVQAFASLQTNTNDFSSNPSSHLYGLAASLPFGDPAYRSRRARAAFSEIGAQNNREALEESIRLDVIQSRQAYQAAVASLPIVKQAVASAAQSLKLFRPLYRSGRQSIIEVLRAEEGLARAEAASWQTRFQLHATYIRLMMVIGKLDDLAVHDVAQQLEVRP